MVQTVVQTMVQIAVQTLTAPNMDSGGNREAENLVLWKSLVEARVSFSLCLALDKESDYLLGINAVFHRYYSV